MIRAFHARQVRALADAIESSELFWWSVVTLACLGLLALDRLLAG